MRDKVKLEDLSVEELNLLLKSMETKESNIESDSSNLLNNINQGIKEKYPNIEIDNDKIIESSKNNLAYELIKTSSVDYVLKKEKILSKDYLKYVKEYLDFIDTDYTWENLENGFKEINARFCRLIPNEQKENYLKKGKAKKKYLPHLKYNQLSQE